MSGEEYNICVEQFADKLYRFVLKNIGDEAKARDIVQDTFEKLWMRMTDLKFGTVKSYLFKVAYNTMIDSIRKDKSLVFYEELPDTQGEMQNTDFFAADVIDAALKKLPDIQRSLILLRDYEGYNYKEIGEISGLSESQVKVYIFRARKFLQQILKKADLLI
jgi:RNA polymerase sigma factor (sigma-70 family)